MMPRFMYERERPSGYDDTAKYGDPVAPLGVGLLPARMESQYSQVMAATRNLMHKPTGYGTSGAYRTASLSYSQHAGQYRNAYSNHYST